MHEVFCENISIGDVLGYKFAIMLSGNTWIHVSGSYLGDLKESVMASCSYDKVCSGMLFFLFDVLIKMQSKFRATV